MEKEELNWEQIEYSYPSFNKTNSEYNFEIGCNVLISHSLSSFICFNKNSQNFSNKQIQITNDYFRCDELNSEEKKVKSLFLKSDGPRFRITSIAGNESKSIDEESFYFFGGIIPYNKDTNIYLDDFWKYEIFENSFRRVLFNGDKISARGGHTISFYKEKNTFYLFGGKNDSERFNDIHELDINKNKARKIPSLTNPPIARNNHTALICKSSLIIYGGWDGTKTLNDMYELSLNTYIWYPINYKGELVPPPVYRHASITLSDSNNIILFGGVNEHNQKFNELFLFNLNSLKWSILPASGNYPAPRTFHNMCESNRKIFIFGGFSKSQNNSCYSIQLQTFATSQTDTSDIERKSSPSVNEQEDKQTEFIFDNKILSTDTLNNNSHINSIISLLHNQVKELKIKYESEVSKNICKICFEREINTVILDCCHRFVCYDCSFKCENKCPLCKRDIKEILKTFN